MEKQKPRVGKNGSSSDATKANSVKEYLIAQEYLVQGVHYYLVKAATMGEAIDKIEDDPELLPDSSEIVWSKILSYVEADDNYDS